MKKYPALITIIMALCLISCISNNSNNQIKEDKLKPVITIDNNNLDIVSYDKDNYSIKISCNNICFVDSSFKDVYSQNMIDLLNSHNDKIEIAYIATSGLGHFLPLNIKVSDYIDTTFLFNIEPIEIPTNTSTINGTCAPLLLSSNDPNLEMEVKRWLYKRKENVGDYRIKDMLGIIRALNNSFFNQYITNKDIPTVRDLSNCIYSVKSSMIADHYILCAFSTETELDLFIEETILNDYKNTSKSAGNNMMCYNAGHNNGYKCISLVGINNDWKYQLEPLGFVCLDNIAPDINDYKSHDLSYNDIILFKNRIFVTLPEKINITGNITIDTKNFRGDDAQFVVYWSGDVKSISMKEYKGWNSWEGKKEELKTINLTKLSSPYYFICRLDLNIGDNYIPITVTAFRGNKSHINFHIPMVSVNDNNPNININNNNSVWN